MCKLINTTSFFNTFTQSYEVWLRSKSIDFYWNVFIFIKFSFDARFFIKFTIFEFSIFRFSLSSHISSSEDRFWTFSYKQKIFLSYRRLHAKATFDHDWKSYKKWTCHLFLRNVMMIITMLSHQSAHSCNVLRWRNDDDVSRFRARQWLFVCDVSRYDAHRALKSVLRWWYARFDYHVQWYVFRVSHFWLIDWKIILCRKLIFFSKKMFCTKRKFCSKKTFCSETKFYSKTKFCFERMFCSSWSHNCQTLIIETCQSLWTHFLPILFCDRSHWSQFLVKCSDL
jgi:hypothetical protein